LSKSATPKFFFLLGVIIVEAVEVFIFHVHHGTIDWIVALIFCGYIGFDWVRENAIPKTMGNTIDSFLFILYAVFINKSGKHCTIKEESVSFFIRQIVWVWK
jgi:hypothetical protein